MDFALSKDQEQLRDAIERVCEPFDADYWLRKDREGGFPDELHRALADAGFESAPVPVTRAHLEAEGLGAAFVDYMASWKGFVEA